MTRAEFEKARRAVPRKAAPIVLGWFFGSALVLLSVSSHFVNWDDKSPLTLRLILRVILPVSLLLAIFCLLPMWFLLRVIYRKHGLLCPSCGNVLTADPSLPTTGKCGKCQSIIFRV